MKKNSKSKMVIPTILTVLFALLLSACGGAAEAQTLEMPIAVEAEAYPEEGLAFDVAGEASAGMPVEAPSPENRDGGSGVVSSLPAQSERLIVMNAEMRLLVEDPAAVMEFVSTLAREHSGFIVASDLGETAGEYGGQVPYATITIRVPAARLPLVLNEIEGQALEILNKNLSGKDVTSDYTDLQSRLRNLEKAEEQLTQVMQAADRTTDVLQVYAELTKVTEQIEIIKGQIQYYEESAAYSAVSLVLKFKETPPPQPTYTNIWQPGKIAKHALEDLRSSLQYWTGNAIRFSLYRLPLLLIKLAPYAAVLWLGYRFIGRRWLKSRTQPTAAD